MKESADRDFSHRETKCTDTSNKDEGGRLMLMFTEGVGEGLHAGPSGVEVARIHLQLFTF